MRKVYLHIGMPKTGTTAIQQAFSASRRTLRANGLAYPGDQADHALLIPLFHEKGAHHGYCRRRGLAPTEALRSGRELLEDLARLSQTFEGNVLLSSEHFRTFSDTALEALDAHLAGLGYELHVICYVRHPLAAAVSATQQNVKVGNATLAELFAQPRWHSLIRTLTAPMKSLGHERVIVRPYENARDVGAEKDILRLVGYGGSLDEIAAVRANTSASATAIWLIDAFHQIRRETPVRPRLRSRLLKLEGPRFALPRSTVEKVLDRGLREVKWMKKHFAIELQEPRLEGEWPKHYTPEAAKAVLKRMIRSQTGKEYRPDAFFETAVHMAN